MQMGTRGLQKNDNNVRHGYIQVKYHRFKRGSQSDSTNPSIATLNLLHFLEDNCRLGKMKHLQHKGRLKQILLTRERIFLLLIN